MEIEEGLAQLRIDIGNGKFEKVKNEYNNNCGDYLFISAEKNKSKWSQIIISWMRGSETLLQGPYNQRL